MAAKVPAKSILKQQAPHPKPTLSDEQKAQAERDRRNLGIALQHANRIQHQKDVEAQILSNIETLLGFPAGSSFTSSEASKFVSLIHPFQPSDFDSLIEERRIDGKCGYALCSKAPRSVTLGANAAWKLKAKGGGDYCSNDCLRKALYVKAQLSEVPAWEREPGQQAEIVLHEDDRSSTVSSDEHAADRVQKRVANERELALERGETASSFKPGQVMTPTVVEGSNGSRKSTNTFNTTTSSHMAIEGYEPYSGYKQTQSQTQPVEESSGYNVDPSEDHNVDHHEEDAWRDLFDNMNKR